ncbi:class I SAM-dependent methyltransferase [Streptomyces sp. C10-9-1]|uniref:class I SAM-dependent methyltransferase n=1 Tax=Streptomyces sp. C10-9-1 TaxID=1859285 RepID=UPI002112BEC7|nr:class I SAM-dependent methyltransferase [Streptomyces sp. C10-9-1]MCQ6553396.1 class I SAM-dependent methyltransferase [Streptomyces sp. C10-9-1]
MTYGRTVDPDETAEEHWDNRYRESERMWSGEPNAALVAEAAGMTPGRALDIGCGEGADAIWLARRGWRVTAVDVSGVALERAARHAREAGAGTRVDWQRHDLAVSFPSGEWDLVSAHYLHAPGELPRDAVLRRAAAAVAPDGVLLVVGHADAGAREEAHHHGTPFPTPEAVLEQLRLEPGGWAVERAAEFERARTGREGRPGLRRDNILRVRRLPG